MSAGRVRTAVVVSLVVAASFAPAPSVHAGGPLRSPFLRAEALLSRWIHGPGIERRVPSWTVVAARAGEAAPPNKAPPFEPRVHTFDGTNFSTPDTPGGFCTGITGLEAAVYEYAVRGRAPPEVVLDAVPELGAILEDLRERGDPSLTRYMESDEAARERAVTAALGIFPTQGPTLAARGDLGDPDPEELRRRIDVHGYAVLFFGTRYRKVSAWWNPVTRRANGGHAMLFDSYREVTVRNRAGVTAPALFFHAVDSNLDETEEDFPDFGLLQFPRARGVVPWSWAGSPEGPEHIEMRALDAYQNGDTYHSAAELLLPPERFWEHAFTVWARRDAEAAEAGSAEAGAGAPASLLGQ